MKTGIIMLISLMVIGGFAGVGFAETQLLQVSERDAAVIDTAHVTGKVGSEKPEASKAYNEKAPSGTEGTKNTIYGYYAGHVLTSEAEANTLVGESAGTSLTIGDANTLIGAYSGRALTDQTNNAFVGVWTGLDAKGSSNTFIGYSAGYKDSYPYYNGGQGNTFVGRETGSANTNGYHNVFAGMNAGKENANGKWNTFIGHEAGKANTTADSNTFVGDGAGKANISGSYNTFVGDAAGLKNIDGHSNIFIGDDAGYENTGGDENVFIGREAGRLNTSGSWNTFLGRLAGKSNDSGAGNTFVGYRAGEANEGGGSNVFLGAAAGNNNKSGTSDVFLGRSAGSQNTHGAYNTFVGHTAGNQNIEGSRNVFLGYQAGYFETGSDKLYIDNSTTDKPLIWGDFSTNNVVVYGAFKAVAIYSTSDGRLKKNIQPLKSSLEKVSDLQGVSYEWKTDVYPDIGLSEGKQIGFVAQDVERVLPELVSEDKDGYKSVSYSKLTAVLVEAIKELKASQDVQMKSVSSLAMRVEKVQKEIRKGFPEVARLSLQD